MKHAHVFLAAGLAAICLTACRKEQDPVAPLPDFDTTTATGDAKAEDAFTDLLAMVEQAVRDNGLRDLCDPAVTFDTIAMPHTITIDFGEVNCTAANGRTRRGRILVSYTGPYRAAGTVITITPQDYYVNDHHVQGTKTVTNMGDDGAGHPYFTVTVNGSLTAPDGSWTSTHQAQRIRTWIAGYDTPEVADDEYLVTGTGSGVNRNGVPYELAITQALHVKMSCPFIVAGTVQIMPAGRPALTIDYGDGSCDGVITVSVNGHSFTVTIG